MNQCCNQIHSEPKLNKSIYHCTTQQNDMQSISQARPHNASRHVPDNAQNLGKKFFFWGFSFALFWIHAPASGVLFE